MNRIAGNHSISIFNLFCFKRKIQRIFLIHLAECCTNSITCRLILARKKQSTSYYFKSFICSYRFPDRLLTTKCMLNSFKSSLTAFSFTNFDCGFRNRCNNHAVLAGTGCLCNLLNKCDEIIERTCRKSGHSVNCLSIGNKLIHQD